MTATSINHAPGAPGAPPHWTSSSKTGVGTALSAQCNVWFTIEDGALTEVYFPMVDRPAIRDLQLIVTDGRAFMAEERYDVEATVELPHRGVPAYRLLNTSREGRFRIEKEIIADPSRPVVLQRIKFSPLVGSLHDYHVYALLAPHLGGQGHDNTARLGDYKGHPMLLAERDDLALALACSTGWQKRSAGYIGASDGWQDLKKHRQLTWQYDEARNGNVALVGEIPLGADGSAVLALAFGRRPPDAAHLALASLLSGFTTTRELYIQQWETWQRKLLPEDKRYDISPDVYRTSAAVLRIHESKRLPGALIASLSIPWGSIHGDKDRGGYHLVWVRDMSKAAGALLAISEHPKVREMLVYLRATQEPDGRWPQNMWLNGTEHWDGVQLDEMAQAITLLDLAWREKAIDRDEVDGFWPMVRRAAGFLVRKGPVTEQDRWEKNGGYSTSTLAALITALLAAADMAELHGEHNVAAYLRDTADEWNDNIERWTYASNTELARRLGIDGYYVEIAPPNNGDGTSALSALVQIGNNPEGQTEFPAYEIIGTNALELVRQGLRRADDPRIVNTVRAIDALLKIDLSAGPIWRRYNHDGYGEHADGSPFDGSGIGRAWPLLVGERAHYELAAGRTGQAVELLHTLESLANEAHLLPEQTWDAEDISSRALRFGRPSGSAMPLVWAHAEYLKLCRSLRDGKVFDMPRHTVDRYLVRQTKSRHATWRFDQKLTSLPAGKLLRLQLDAQATIHWSSDNWKSIQDMPTHDSGLGFYFAELPTSHLPPGQKIVFTYFWTASANWEQRDFEVSVVKPLQDRLNEPSEILEFAGPDNKRLQSRDALHGKKGPKAAAETAIIKSQSQREAQ